jgi:PIN domain nuclease of toxin-antitoxin system
MPATVLDSHALVACFRDEPGAGRVETLLTNSVPADLLLQMTKVNYAKVMYTLIRKDGPAAWEAAAQVLVGLPIEFPTGGPSVGGRRC